MTCPGHTTTGRAGDGREDTGFGCDGQVHTCSLDPGSCSKLRKSLEKQPRQKGTMKMFVEH